MKRPFSQTWRWAQLLILALLITSLAGALSGCRAPATETPAIGLDQGPIINDLSVFSTVSDGGSGTDWNGDTIGIGTPSDFGIATGSGEIGLAGTSGISLGDFSLDDDIGDDYGGFW